MVCLGGRSTGGYSIRCFPADRIKTPHTLLANAGPDGADRAAVAGAVVALAVLLLAYWSRSARPEAPNWGPQRLAKACDGGTRWPASSRPIGVRMAGSRPDF